MGLAEHLTALQFTPDKQFGFGRRHRLNGLEQWFGISAEAINVFAKKVRDFFG